MNYETASDNQINFRLAELLSGGNQIDAAVRYEEFCSNPNQIWPLIVQYRITVDMFQRCAWGMTSTGHVSHPFNPATGKPLRAAAICIIQLLEQQQ